MTNLNLNKFSLRNLAIVIFVHLIECYKEGKAIRKYRCVYIVGTMIGLLTSLDQNLLTGFVRVCFVNQKKKITNYFLELLHGSTINISSFALSYTWLTLSVIVPSLLMSNTRKICFKFSSGVPFDMMYRTIMNSRKSIWPSWKTVTWDSATQIILFVYYWSLVCYCPHVGAQGRDSPCWSRTFWRCVSRVFLCPPRGNTPSSLCGKISAIFYHLDASWGSSDSDSVEIILFIQISNSTEQSRIWIPPLDPLTRLYSWR